jgi:hypothetical protein
LGGLFLSIQPVLAQGTAFTYQGQLTVGGSPANGNDDLTLALFNNSTTNTGKIGSTLTNLDVGVTNGLFTVTVDFGPVFTGNATWLAIGVRTNGGTAFTTLNPLQELTPAPYAIYAPNAGSAATATTAGTANSVAAANITGTVALAQLPSAMVTNNEANVTLGGSLYLAEPATVYSGANSLLISDGQDDFYAGLKAGNLTTTGNGHTGLGFVALFNNGSGTQNTAVEADALFNNTSGSYNTVEGVEAMIANTRGSNNTANGFFALSASQTGNYNTADGGQALLSSTNGNFNVAVGNDAMKATLNDSAEVAIGYQALKSDAAGFGNTAIGYQTLNQNTTGEYNTANGDYALAANTTGSNNTANGVSALNFNVSGQNNTAVGASALVNMATTPTAPTTRSRALPQ